MTVYDEQLARILAQQQDVRALGNQALIPGQRENLGTALARALTAGIAKGQGDYLATQQDQITQQKNEAMRNALMNIGGQPTREAGIQALLSQSQYLDPTSMSLASALLPPAPKQPEPFSLSKGQTRYSGEGKPIAYGGEEKPDLSSWLNDGRALGISDEELRRLFSEKATKPGSEINFRGETEYAKTVGRVQGEQSTEVPKAAEKSRLTLSKVDQINDVVGRLEQLGGKIGKGAPIDQFITEVGQYLNVDPNTLKDLGLSTDAGPYQALDALFNEIVLSKIGATDEGGMPANNFSDADRKFVQDTGGRKTDTREGLAIKLEMMKRVAQRNIELEDLYFKLDADRNQEGYRQFIRERRKIVSKGNLFDGLNLPGAKVDKTDKKYSSPEDVANSTLTREEKIRILKNQFGYDD